MFILSNDKGTKEDSDIQNDSENIGNEDTYKQDEELNKNESDEVVIEFDDEDQDENSKLSEQNINNADETKIEEPSPQENQKESIQEEIIEQTQKDLDETPPVAD